MSFKDIIGHKNEIDYFMKSLIQKRLAHAIIIQGADGVGKSLMGYKLAEAILCDSASGDACGICRSCIKMGHANHPDYMSIEPDGTQIKTNQIELFQEFLNVKSYDGMYKVVLINEADKMNTTSQNKILKTLEEPPENVIIIMVTNNCDHLLPTVISRCQIIKLSGVSQELIREYVQTEYNLSNEKSRMISKLADGSIGKAIQYINSEFFARMGEEVKSLLVAINNNQKSKVLECCSFFTAEKENYDEILSYMTLWYRDLLLFKKAKAKELLIHEQEIDDIKKWTRNLTVKKIIDNIEMIETTKKKLTQHGHFDLTIEVMLIKLLED